VFNTAALGNTTDFLPLRNVHTHLSMKELISAPASWFHSSRQLTYPFLLLRFFLFTQDGSTELGYPEFVQFVGVVKSLEDVCRNDPQMRDKYFPPPASATALSPAKPSPAKPSRRASVHVALAELLRRSGSEAGGSAEGALHRVRAWNRVVAHLNEDALTGAWDMVRSVRG